jgi:DNA invertase Pin-like site-specific DNA recombinase
MQEQPKAPAVLYAAKSSPDERGSIPDQLKEARAKAQERGFEVVAEYSEEDVSAYKGDRGPELAKAMEHAQRTRATLFVQHSDRLARGDAKQARHLVEIALWAIKAEVEIHCVRDPSTFESLLAAVVMGDRNMEDSRRKADAVRDGLARRRKKGKFWGVAPFGYKHRRNNADERVLVKDPPRAEVVRRVYAEYLAGRSLTAIAQGLNADGILTMAKKKRWSPVMVRAMLRRPTYAGLLRDGEELIKATHEAIIDRKTWEQTQALHRAKARTHKRGRPSSGRHLFRKGFLRCGICGSSMVPITERRAQSNEYYRCQGRAEDASACSMRFASRARIDDAVYAYFEQLELDLGGTHRQLLASLERQQAETRSLLDEAEQEAQAAAQRLARVRHDYTDGELSAAEWRELRGELESEATAAEAEAERLRTKLAESEAEAALSEVEADVLAQLAQIRAEIAEEVLGAEGAAAVRAVLMRLFDGFVLHEGQNEERLKKPGYWIEPLLSELTLAGDDEKPCPALAHKPLAQAKNNFSSRSVARVQSTPRSLRP